MGYKFILRKAPPELCVPNAAPQSPAVSRKARAFRQIYKINVKITLHNATYHLLHKAQIYAKIIDNCGNTEGDPFWPGIVPQHAATPIALPLYTSDGIEKAQCGVTDIRGASSTPTRRTTSGCPTKSGRLLPAAHAARASSKTSAPQPCDSLTSYQ